MRRTSSQRQVFSRLVVASGLLTLACATAMEEGPLNGDVGEELTGGTSSVAGTAIVAGTSSNLAGASSSAGATSSSGGSKANAFGGTGPTLGGAAGGGNGGTASGGTAAGSSSGGKAGTSSGGSAAAGTSSGGKGNAGSASGGSASGGSGTAGSTSATCGGVADWTAQKTYALGDTVAWTCSGVFAGACNSGQHHKFECNPMAGTAALPWCQSREPGVGNGWAEAWVDKGQCQ